MKLNLENYKGIVIFAIFCLIAISCIGFTTAHEVDSTLDGNLTVTDDLVVVTDDVVNNTVVESVSDDLVVPTDGGVNGTVVEPVTDEEQASEFNWEDYGIDPNT